MPDLRDVLRTGSRSWRIGLLNGPNMVHLERRERERCPDHVRAHEPQLTTERAAHFNLLRGSVSLAIAED